MDLAYPSAWFGGSMGELVHVLHREQLREVLLPLGNDRRDAFHSPSLVGMHVNEWRTLVHVHVQRWRGT